MCVRLDRWSAGWLTGIWHGLPAWANEPCAPRTTFIGMLCESCISIVRPITYAGCGLTCGIRGTLPADGSCGHGLKIRPVSRRDELGIPSPTVARLPSHPTRVIDDPAWPTVLHAAVLLVVVPPRLRPALPVSLAICLSYVFSGRRRLSLSSNPRCMVGPSMVGPPMRAGNLDGCSEGTET